MIRPFLMAAAHWDPLLLCLAALAGEEPADHLQRVQLNLGYPHPLIEKITRIHVTEEARHISFARHFIRRAVPRLGRLRRGALGLAFPVFMFIGAKLMVEPSRSFRRTNKIPRDVLRSAYDTAEARQTFAASVQKARDLADELGLMKPASRLLWHRLFDRPIAKAA